MIERWEAHGCQIELTAHGNEWQGYVRLIEGLGAYRVCGPLDDRSLPALRRLLEHRAAQLSDPGFNVFDTPTGWNLIEVE
jgi:hypothetical protein